MKRNLLTFLTGLGMAGFAAGAYAKATVTLSDGINPTTVIIDNVAPDASTGAGMVLAVRTVGVWQVVVSGITKPSLGTALAPVMDLNIQATSTAAGTLTVTFSDNNFGAKSGSMTGVLTAQETGTLVYGDGTVDFKVFGDSGNTVTALTSLLADAGPQPWPPLFSPFPGSAALSQPYSLTEVMVFNVTMASHLNLDGSFQLTPDVNGPAGCRVTGGSNKETNNFQSACITTTVPSFISHGGQVGAALSDETPWTPADKCISGEWQHNRHLTGGSLVGVLHASGNRSVHQFDSLLCACLPCPENLGAVGVVGNVCNPGDKICGPDPRHAPANKICFSGVGDYTFSNGPRTVKAVFRVDIEDRSEGNSASSTLPPDRYRIRIWVLDPSCGRDPNPDSSANMALRFGASADPNKIVVLSTTEDLKVPSIAPPDIDDGGDMVQGNHQIHPSTGARCK